MKKNDYDLSNMLILPDDNKLNPSRYVCRIIVSLILAGIVIYFLNPFIIPLATGAVLASALLPIRNRLFHSKTSGQSKLTAKMQALVITTVVTLGILLPVAGAVYVGVKTILSKSEVMSEAAKAVTADNAATPVSGVDKQAPSSLQKWFSEQKPLTRLQEKLKIPKKQLYEALGQVDVEGKKFITDSAKAFIGNLPLGILSLIVLIASIYCVLAYDKEIGSWLQAASVLPSYNSKILGSTFHNACESVVIATFISGSVQATLLSLTSWIAGFGNPALIFVFAYFASFFPSIGTGLVSIVMIVLSVIQGDSSSAIIFAVGGSLAGLADNAVAPFLIGSRSRLPPLLTFTVTLGAISVIGIYGVFLGPVCLAMLMRGIELMGTNASKQVVVDLNVPMEPIEQPSRQLRQ